MRRFLKGVIKSLIATVLFFAIAEAALRGLYGIRNAFVRRVPLPYALGDEYGPVPPWLDRLMILAPDPVLIWRSLPNVHRTYVDIFSPVRSADDRVALLRRFVPTLPAEFRDNPTWTIDLNSEGYRGPEFTAAKPPATVRVACIGDSWTFGMNVDQPLAYPDRLAAHLRELAPASRFEVLNFGVLGYSSFQGLQLLKARVLALHPDVVAIGFGMNDSGVPGYRDKDMIAVAPPRLTRRAVDAAKELELYTLLDYVAHRMRFRPKTIGDYLKAESEKATDPVDYTAMEAWTRVSPADYERNLREMIQLARDAGATAVLLDNELWEGSPYRPLLKKIAADARVLLVDSFQLISDARAATQRDVERGLHLDASEGSALDAEHSSTPASTTVVFRVHRGAFAVPSAMSIVGNDPQLGDFAPNTILMHDDGMGGDQRKGDGVWSHRATFPPGSGLRYVYTNSGGRGQWEGLDVPHIRELIVPSSSDGKPIYLPVETFGRVYMQADNWHTDAAGYELIARGVADAIVKSRASSLTSRVRRP
jgi:lysophospholipase L1-like esterase